MHGKRNTAEFLHIGRPNIGERATLLARLNEILDRHWLSNNGINVQEFESRVACSLGVRHCVTVCNATIGLEVVIRALGLTGQVIVPSFTFIATAHSLQWQQITPVFCDIDPVTHNMNPAQVEALITPRTTAIMAVHLWGRACDVQALQEIAARHELKLLFDAAHAFGCSYGGRMIGGFGDAEVFSFHATKFINTLEGGMITTNNDQLAARIRRMINFGFTGYDCVESIGTNGKMNEFSAAMGLTNLESMDEFIAVNRSHYHSYRQNLDALPGITVMPYDESERCNFQYVVVEVDEKRAGVSRDALEQHLHEQGIIARRYFYPGCHRMEPYRSSDPDAGRHLPVTEWLCERLMCLPTGTGVQQTDVERVCQCIADFVNPN